MLDPRIRKKISERLRREQNERIVAWLLGTAAPRIKLEVLPPKPETAELAPVLLLHWTRSDS